jgi:hypothetical protein
MRTRANGKFVVMTWDEKPYQEFEGGGKLTRASVKQSFHGDIEGDATVEFLMVYCGDGSASFVGHQRVVGRVGGRTGSFVLQCSGVHEKGAARCTWFVVPGSGTGELGALRGEGGYTARHEDYPNVPITLDYEFASLPSE